MNTAIQQQSASQVSAFEQRHPNWYAAFNAIKTVADFFINGHFIKALGRWVIQVGGYVAESVLMFAVLWVTCTSVAPALVELFMSKQLMQYLVWLSLAALALIPEIILANAIVNAVGHWLAVLRDRHNVGAWIWAVLFTIPTILFLILTAITLNTLGANGGNVVQASADTVNLRLDAGWLYGLLELTYAGVKKWMPQQSLISVSEPAPALEPVNYRQLAECLEPLLRERMLSEIRELASEPAPDPEPLDYQRMALALAPLLSSPALSPEPATPRAEASDAAKTTIFEESQATPALDAPKPAWIAEKSSASQRQSEPASMPSSELNTRLEAIYQELRDAKPGQRVSGRALAAQGHIGRANAIAWLKASHPENDEPASGFTEATSKPEPGHEVSATPEVSEASEESLASGWTEEIPALTIEMIEAMAAEPALAS